MCLRRTDKKNFIIGTGGGEGGGLGSRVMQRLEELMICGPQLV